MSLNTANQYISKEDYLADELISEFKREYINGYLYPITDSTNWQVEYYYLGDTISFSSIDLTLSVADIYARVNNEDRRDYLAKLATTENTSLL